MAFLKPGVADPSKYSPYGVGTFQGGHYRQNETFSTVPVKPPPMWQLLTRARVACGLTDMNERRLHEGRNIFYSEGRKRKSQYWSRRNFRVAGALAREKAFTTLRWLSYMRKLDLPSMWKLDY